MEFIFRELMYNSAVSTIALLSKKTRILEYILLNLGCIYFEKNVLIFQKTGFFYLLIFGCNLANEIKKKTFVVKSIYSGVLSM